MPHLTVSYFPRMFYRNLKNRSIHKFDPKTYKCQCDVVILGKHKSMETFIILMMVIFLHNEFFSMCYDHESCFQISNAWKLANQVKCYLSLYTTLVSPQDIFASRCVPYPYCPMSGYTMGEVISMCRGC